MPRQRHQQQQQHTDPHADHNSATALPRGHHSRLTALSSAPPTSIALRDGEVIVYRRSRRLLYQCRYKLADGAWVRQTTGKAALEHAIARACDLYDEARYRQRLGLAHRTHLFAHIAQACVGELRQQIDLRGKKTALNDYVSCIERYFIPYFGERSLETLTASDIADFEVWRDRQLQRRPKTSTLNNFTSAWNRVIQTAVQRGRLSERVPVPKLTSKGDKGTTRPAFTEDEVQRLLAYMEHWQQGGRLSVEREMRPLLRDYVEFLLLTGIRHGTEAMNLRWNNLDWHSKDGVRHLRVWVSGKTGGRWLIAKHGAVAVLQRLQARQRDIAEMSFDTTLQSRVPHLVFRFSDGYQPHSLMGSFRRLMRDSGLLLDGSGKTGTLYSLRHTYATLQLLHGDVDLHTLSRQMGNSAAMLPKFDSSAT